MDKEEPNKPVRLFNIYGDNCGTGFAGNVWDINGISPALMTMCGGNREPMIVVYEGIEQQSDKVYFYEPKDTASNE